MKAAAALLLAAALGGCATKPAARSRDPFSDGYQLGTADAVKRLDWVRQALQAPDPAAPNGHVAYYTWQDDGIAADGQRLAPETVAVPVFIPDPAPAAGTR